MIVTNRRDNGGGEGLRFKRSACRSASHSAASSRCGMRRDSSCLFPGAAREQLQNGLRHRCHKVAVLFPTAYIVPPAPCRALLSIGLAFFFCALKRRYLDQDTLAWNAEGSACARSFLLVTSYFLSVGALAKVGFGACHSLK